MAKNEKILEHVKHRRDNMIEGDLRVMLSDVLDELAALRDAHEDVEARLKKVEKK
jgi:hypothetical protein